jgi:hypothetical protein
LLLDSTRITCMLQHARGAWWCISKATSCRLWRDRYNLQGARFWGVTKLKLEGEANQY